MTRHQYSSDDKAAALAALEANGGNLRLTSRQLKIPLTTLHMWASGHVPNDVPNLRTEKKAELQDELRRIAYALVEAIPAKVDSANLQQIATTLGIVIDKMQLLSGQPTDRSQIDITISDEERVARIASLLDAARARRDGQPAHSTDD